jgi:hypothetical protein
MGVDYGEMRDLIFALTATENEPHQFMEDPRALAVAFLKIGVTGESNPQFCPNWGDQGGKYGPCHKCLNCMVREGVFDTERDIDERSGEGC